MEVVGSADRHHLLMNNLDKIVEAANRAIPEFGSDLVLFALDIRDPVAYRIASTSTADTAAMDAAIKRCEMEKMIATWFTAARRKTAIQMLAIDAPDAKRTLVMPESGSFWCVVVAAKGNSYVKLPFNGFPKA